MTGIHLNGDAWIVLVIVAVLVLGLFATGGRSS
jgi:hypothetical protein